MSDAAALTVTVRIAASPAAVFPYLIESSLLVQWLGDTADLHPEPGGMFSVDIDNAPVRGRFVLVEPPHRVVFTWGLAGSDELPEGSTTVEIVLTADGQDTVVELTHRDLPPDQVAQHRAGWTMRLGQLGVQSTRH